VTNYLEYADELAHFVMHVWATKINAGEPKALAPDFIVLFDRMLVYKRAREIAQERRELNVLIESDEVNERVTCEQFCAAYEVFRQKHTSSSE
jgi:hypothetical protein